MIRFYMCVDKVDRKVLCFRCYLRNDRNAYFRIPDNVRKHADEHIEAGHRPIFDIDLVVNRLREAQVLHAMRGGG